jgi:hypothetical protein
MDDSKLDNVIEGEMTDEIVPPIEPVGQDEM